MFELSDLQRWTVTTTAILSVCALLWLFIRHDIRR